VFILCDCSEKVPEMDSSDGFSVSDENAENEAVTENTTSPILEHAEGVYVYDNANLLNKKDFEECNDYAEFLYENYLINTAVVTASSLDGQTPAEFAETSYNELYDGDESGLLLLINDDTYIDFLYKKGNCADYISDDDEKSAFYTATREIVDNDYKSAVLRIMKLAESCPQYVFDNAEVFSEDEITELLQVLESKNISVVTVHGKAESKLCEQYRKRLYSDGKGCVIMIDNKSGKIFADGDLPEDFDDVLSEAQNNNVSDSYMSAVMSVIDKIST
nr:TPM domain-containing protein [Ruminococcus sp.]